MVLIIVTNCYTVYFQYALFVSIHQDCLFLSYCGILMHINSLQHIVAQHFVQIQRPLDLMLFLLFSGIHRVPTRNRVFSTSSLFFVQLPLWITPLYSLYGKLHKKNLKYLRYSFPCLSLLELQTYLIEELTFLVLKIGFLLIFCTHLILVLCVLFFYVALFLIRSWNFVDFGTFLLKRLRT